MKPRLIVKKTHTSHINRLRVMLPTKDSDPGEVIVLAEQKRFVRVETTLCYSNEQREKVAFVIRFLASDSGQHSYVVEETNGRVLGTLVKLPSMPLRPQSWRVLDQNGAECAVTIESSSLVGGMRRQLADRPIIGRASLALSKLANYRIIILEPVSRKQTGVYERFGPRKSLFHLSMKDTSWQAVDWRVYAALSIALTAPQTY